MYYKRAIVIGVLLLTGLGLIIFGAILQSQHEKELRDQISAQESAPLK
jgi:hypothetical protein